MTSWQLKTPVIFMVFKRPDTTEKVFEVIRQAKPPKLLVIADGARSHKVGELEKCAAVRSIIDRVDWECKVFKNYADANMGCKHRISSGLDWAFSLVEEAIILEDDCLPHPTFFRFCEEILEKYRNTEPVMMVCGTNILGEWKSDHQSYCFSHYSTCWGWATWRRAWQHYDIDMRLWLKPEGKEKIQKILGDRKHYKTWEEIFNSAYTDEIDTWAIRWLLTRWMNSGLSVIPAINLISNIGFGEESSHTTDSTSEVSNLTTQTISFPLKDPSAGLMSDRDYSDAFYQKMFLKKTSIKRFLRRSRKFILNRLRTVVNGSKTATTTISKI
jgi:hypothetical protein